MSISDPITNMLTIIRNGYKSSFPMVKVAYSVLNEEVLKVMVKEGFLKEFKRVKVADKNFDQLEVSLKYGPQGEKVIQHIRRISTPGCRIYIQKDDIPRIKNGFGLLVLTTPKGVLSGREARQQKVGGEVICEVW